MKFSYDLNLYPPEPGLSGGRTWWAHFEFTRINIEPIIRLEGEKNGGAFEFFADGVGRFRSIETPPVLGRTDLRLGEIGDLNLERSAHSRLRMFARRSLSGVVWPRPL
jgi:hypothetical protein